MQEKRGESLLVEAETPATSVMKRTAYLLILYGRDRHCLALNQ
jgi:hypothetical protein